MASFVTRTEPPQVFTEIGRHPRLFRAWLPFAGTLLLGGALPRVDAELVILRTAWNAGCEYEREQHLELAARSGLGDAQIAAVSRGVDAQIWTPRERLLLAAVDQLHANRCVDIATRSDLEAELSRKQFVELCFLVGHYEMLAMLLNSRGVEPDSPLSPRRSDLGHWSEPAGQRTLDV
jgi:alkylhydroperoxidase family enzyme